MQRLICRFSHQYTKLCRQTSARLLDVKRMNLEDIDPLAIEFDTMWYDENLNPQYYKLDPGAYLRMAFIGNRGIPFTTYRTDTPEHFKKYADNIGKVFQIYVEENKGK